MKMKNAQMLSLDLSIRRNLIITSSTQVLICMGNDTMQQVIKCFPSYEFNKAETVSKKKYMIR